MKNLNWSNWVFFLLLLLTLASANGNALGSEPTANLELEWEAVPNAGAYEVKLTPSYTDASLKFMVKENKLKEQVPAGTYKLEIRTQDVRNGEFGPWSNAIQVEAIPKVLDLLSPSDGSVFTAANKQKRLSIFFEWTKVSGIKEYTMRLWSDDEKKAQSFIARKNSKQLSLPIGREYHWQVLFKSKGSVSYQADPKIYSFTLMGDRLLQPVIAPVKLPTIEGVTWSPSPGAQFYETKILKRALDEEEWKPADKTTEKLTARKFERLPPGVYRIEVTAHANNRLASEPGYVEFVVKPSEEELAAALKSIQYQ